MNLVEYLQGARRPDRSWFRENFPRQLTLPADLSQSLFKLYKDGENNGCEFGQTAFFRTTKNEVEVSAVQKGTAVSVQCDRTTDPDEFGDLHSHPSMSIGHLNGFSAHSLEDYKVFAHHLAKPLFIRFVSSGNWLYALVYRQGLSQYDAAFIDERIRKHNTNMTDYFNRYSPVKDQMNALANEMESQPLNELLRGKEKLATTKPEMAAQRRAIIEWQKLEWKKQTPNYGQFMMDASIGYNTLMASHKKFGFYSGLKSEILELRAGPASIL
jgi:hypothetical protein